MLVNSSLVFRGNIVLRIGEAQTALDFIPVILCLKFSTAKKEGTSTVFSGNAFSFACSSRLLFSLYKMVTRLLS